MYLLVNPTGLFPQQLPKLICFVDLASAVHTVFVYNYIILCACNLRFYFQPLDPLLWQLFPHLVMVKPSGRAVNRSKITSPKATELQNLLGRQIGREVCEVLEADLGISAPFLC